VTFSAGSSQLHRNLALLLLLGFCGLGATNSFLLPPFQVPDERRHWLSAHHHLAKWITGSGRVCSTDVTLDRHFKLGIKFRPEAKLPSGIYSRVARLTPECEEQLLYPRSNVGSYPGVALSRLFVAREPHSGPESLFGFYLARLLQGFGIAGIVWRLLRLAEQGSPRPPGLLALGLLTLSPLFVQQSFGVTNDGVTIAFALLVCSWITFPERQTRIDQAGLLAFGAMAALTKPVLSIPLLPAIALGLYLEWVRRDPQPLHWRSFAREVARRWPFALGLVVISAMGVAFASAHLDLGVGRPAAQLAFVRENPGHLLGLVGAKLATYVRHPSVFLDNLGHMSAPVSARTLGCFGALAAIVGLAELALLGSQARGRAGRSRRSRGVYVGFAVLAFVAIAALAASTFAIGLRAYLVDSPVGGKRLYALQPRYFFPHGVLGIGIAMATLRTFVPGVPVAARDLRDGRGGPIAVRTAVGLAFAALLALAASLATDLLARYS